MRVQRSSSSTKRCLGPLVNRMRRYTSLTRKRSPCRLGRPLQPVNFGTRPDFFPLLQRLYRVGSVAVPSLVPRARSEAWPESLRPFHW